MVSFQKKFEEIVIISLSVMMVVVLLLATIDLGWLIVKDIFSPPYFLLNIGELLDIFGMFLLVIIGIELLGSIRTYLQENVIHVEVVMVVAIIAISRKVIVLDVTELDALTLIGIGAIILALSSGYFMLKHSR